MKGRDITGTSVVAGVVGAPIAHSLSPFIHNAWLEAAAHDGIYVPFAPAPARFEPFIEGLRGGALVGLNVTSPFKQRALALADRADAAARSAGAANLLLFQPDGSIEARNTDGIGIFAAFADQAPDWTPGTAPVVVLGAGGAARGAVAALLDAGATVRIVNRTVDRAVELSEVFQGVSACSLPDLGLVLRDAGALINATPLNPETSRAVVALLGEMPARAVVMDMVYTPLETALLAGARACHLQPVDGLGMLIGQAQPSFEAFFGFPPPATPDIRARVERMLEAR